MGILRTRLGRVLESAEGPPEVTQGSTPGPKVSMRKDRFKVTALGSEAPLEKGMATHSSNLAWRISRSEEPGGLQSMGSQRVRH